jgi:hypothetical protein
MLRHLILYDFNDWVKNKTKNLKRDAQAIIVEYQKVEAAITASAAIITAANAAAAAAAAAIAASAPSPAAAPAPAPINALYPPTAPPAGKTTLGTTTTEQLLEVQRWQVQRPQVHLLLQTLQLHLLPYSTNWA